MNKYRVTYHLAPLVFAIELYAYDEADALTAARCLYNTHNVDVELIDESL